MKIILLTIITLLTILSCSEKKEKAKDVNNLEYIFIRRRGQLDTISRQTKYHHKSDTIDIIIYQTIWGENEYEESFKFPKSKDRVVNDTKLIDQKTIDFEGQDYIIYKYLTDDPNGDDEEMLYFYSPKYGILIDKAAWWGNYDKLTKFGTSDDNRIIFYLNEIIANGHEDFFVKWD
jgi:hypothetical protein